MNMKKPNNKPIGVFDSGLGGLTVLKYLLEYLPNENFCLTSIQRKFFP